MEADVQPASLRRFKYEHVAYVQTIKTGLSSTILENERPDDITEGEAKRFMKLFAVETCELYAYQKGLGGEVVRHFFRGSLEDMGVTHSVKNYEKFETSMHRFVYQIINRLKPPGWRRERDKNGKKLSERKPTCPNPKIQAYLNSLAPPTNQGSSSCQVGIIVRMNEFIQGIETPDDDEGKRYYSTMWRLMLNKVASEITSNTLTSVVFNLRSRVEIYFRTLSSDNGMVEYAVWLTFGGQTRPKVVEVDEKLLEVARNIHNDVAGGRPCLDLRYVYEKFRPVAQGDGQEKRLGAMMTVAFKNVKNASVKFPGIQFTSDEQKRMCQEEVKKARSMLAKAYRRRASPKWEKGFGMSDTRRELDVDSLKQVPWQAFDLTVWMLGKVVGHNTVAIERRDARKELNETYSTLLNQNRNRRVTRSGPRPSSVPETFEEYVSQVNPALMKDPIKDTQLKTWDVVAVGEPGEHLSAPVDIEMFYEVLRHMDRHRDIEDNNKVLDNLKKFRGQATEHAAKWIRPGAKRHAVRKGREQDLAWRVNMASISTTTRKANQSNRPVDKKARAAEIKRQEKTGFGNDLYRWMSGLELLDFFGGDMEKFEAAIANLPEDLEFKQRFSKSRDELKNLSFRVFANDPGQVNVACCVDLITGKRYILTRDDWYEKGGINHRCAETNRLLNASHMKNLAEYHKKLTELSSKTVDASKSLERLEFVAENAGMLRKLKYGVLGKKRARLGFNVHCRTLQVLDTFWASLWNDQELEDGEERKPPVVMFEGANFPSGGRGRRTVGVKQCRKACLRMHHTFPVPHWRTTLSCTCAHELEDLTYVARPATKDEKRVKKLTSREKRLAKRVERLEKAESTTKSKMKKAEKELKSARDRLRRAKEKVTEDAQSKEEETRTSRDVKVCKGTCRANGTSLKNRDVHSGYENIGLRGVMKWVFGRPCVGRLHPDKVMREESQVSVPAFDALDTIKTTIEQVECCAIPMEAGGAKFLVEAWKLGWGADAASVSLKKNVRALREAHDSIIREAYEEKNGMSTVAKRRKVYGEAGKAAEQHMPSVKLEASRIMTCLDGVRGILRDILKDRPDFQRPFPARRAADDSRKTATYMRELLSVEQELHEPSGSRDEHPGITKAKAILDEAEVNHQNASAAASQAELSRGRVKERVRASTTGNTRTMVTRRVDAERLAQIEGDADWKSFCMQTKRADEAAKKTRAKIQEFAMSLGRWKGPPRTSEKKSERRYRTGLSMFRRKGPSTLVQEEGAVGRGVRRASSRSVARQPPAKRSATSDPARDQNVGRRRKAPRASRLSGRSDASTLKRSGGSRSDGTRGKRPRRKQAAPARAPG